MVKLEPQRSAGEVHLARDLNQGPQRHAFQRHRVATPERVQVDAVAVIGAIMARQASPHSAASVCWMTGRGPAAEIQQARMITS